jgi:hypothetical protein
VNAGIARRIHAGQVTRAGEPLIGHVERMAHSVPAHDRALAYLHDVLERAEGAAAQLVKLVLTDDERSVPSLRTSTTTCTTTGRAREPRITRGHASSSWHRRERTNGRRARAAGVRVVPREPSGDEREACK